jgi:hypothetical protein
VFDDEGFTAAEVVALAAAEVEAPPDVAAFDD